MRYVGIDYGQKRIGIAVSDSKGRIATPADVFVRSKDLESDMVRLRRALEEWEPAAVVVGLPIGLNGESGPSADKVRTFAQQLHRQVGVEVILHDERMSTHQASRQLREANLSEKAQRAVIDAAAAAVILQSWLDGRNIDPG